MSRFNDENYVPINRARWGALERAQLFTNYRNVSVLDLGAGDGVFSDAFFTQRGAIVTPVEAREENLAVMEADRPDFHKRAIHMNLELDFPVGKWDMVLCVGLLYHVQNPFNILISASEAAPVLFMETVIWQTPDPSGLWIVDEANSFDQAYSGYGSRVSIARLDETLKRLYPYVYAVDIPDHPSFNGGNANEQRVIRVASRRAYEHLGQI